MGAQVKANPGSFGPTLVQIRPFHYTNLFGGPKEVFVEARVVLAFTRLERPFIC
jgi:hypothetical protein